MYNGRYVDLFSLTSQAHAPTMCCTEHMIQVVGSPVLASAAGVCSRLRAFTIWSTTRATHAVQNTADIVCSWTLSAGDVQHDTMPVWQACRWWRLLTSNPTASGTTWKQEGPEDLTTLHSTVSTVKQRRVWGSCSGMLIKELFGAQYELIPCFKVSWYGHGER